MDLIASDKLSYRQSLPLDAKILLFKRVVMNYYDHFDGEVYGAFSGGKDSTVLRHLIRSMGLKIPFVFSNTGLEYPEIVDFVKKENEKHGDIVIVRPERTFRDVIQNDGFPLVSKKVAEMVTRLRKPESESNAATRNLYLTGYKRDGSYSAGSKLSEKWKKLIDAPFNTTNKCCDALKKQPFKEYVKETGRKPIVGVMASEGGQRAMLTQCNVFEGANAQSRPMLAWSEADVWEYIERFNVDYCEIYDDRVIDNVLIKGEERTGCMFCAYGAHLEKGESRFQRMQKSHPKQWNYCINKLGMGKALDFIGVKYEKELSSSEEQLFLNLDDDSNS